MRERYEPALKIACAVLAAVVLIQIGRMAARKNPLADLKIPALPTLATADSAAPGKATNSLPVAGNAAGKTNSTNVVATGKSTNAASPAVAGKTDSNSVSQAATGKSGTNSVVGPIPEKVEAENLKEPKEAGVAAAVPGKLETNGVPGARAGSNSVAGVSAARTNVNSIAGTNAIAGLDPAKGGTNAVNRTNASAQAKGPGARPDMAMMAGGPLGRPGAKKGPDLPPAVQARVDKIVECEILGPVFRPLPMALMGIAGNVAFLRSPSGQTGLVKEGDELGGIKLLRIGTNRVLVEQSGEKKELMIFEGYGSESLMPKEKDKTNETTSKHP